MISVISATQGADPLDSSLGRVPAQGRSRWGAARRLALGTSPAPVPAAVFLATGIAIGPYGLGLLPASIASTLDPFVSAALAALGVLIGLDLQIHRAAERRLLTAGSLEALCTAAAIAGGVFIVRSVSGASDSSVWLLAALAGIAGAPSATVPAEPARDSDSRAERAGDLDDVLPIAAGAVALAWLATGNVAGAAWLTVQTIVIAAAVALAGRLLASHTESAGERRVFGVGIMLLLAGAASYLLMSTVCAGFVAGLLWNRSGSPDRERLAAHVRSLQHPLSVALLLVAGSRVVLSSDLWGLVALFVVCRIAGKYAGGLLAHAAVAPELPRDYGAGLTSTGAVGVALALNVVQAHPALDAAASALGVVVVGALVCDLLSLAATRGGDRR